MPEFIHLVGSDSAVVGALGAGEAALGPPEGVLILVEDGVLLLDAEPRVLILGLLHDLIALFPLVCLRGALVVLEGLAEHELIFATTEGVGVHGHGGEVSVGVLAHGLASRGAVIVPNGKLWKRGRSRLFCSGSQINIHSLWHTSFLEFN